MKHNKKAFTLIELLVVIAIIGILATISVIALSNARAKARDAKRIADTKQVSTALELFFNDNNRYPTDAEFSSGSLFSTSSGLITTYMQNIPSAPTPYDGTCTNDQNTFSYHQTEDGGSYTISMCLGNNTGSLDAGPKCLTPAGIIDVDCSASAVSVCVSDPSSCSWQTVGSAGFAVNNTSFTSLAVDSFGTPYIAYSDGGYSDKSTVMKYDGSSWVNVGNPGFSSGPASYQSLVIYNDIPYLAFANYADYGSGTMWKAVVMKYDGSNWVNVGAAGFSASSIDRISLAIDDNGIPYVAYVDGGNSYRATVMKYDGSNWVNVGNPGFSAGDISRPSIAIDGSNVPYVAYADGGNSYEATVMKYDGSNWVNVGAAGFSAGTVDYTSLSIYDNTLYVAYADGGNSYEATVMKYDGSNWVNVGNPGFSTIMAEDISLHIYNGTPYVAYSHAIVMKYDGSSWVVVGTPNPSAIPIYISSAISSDGVLYVSYGEKALNGNAVVIKFDD